MNKWLMSKFVHGLDGKVTAHTLEDFGGLFLPQIPDQTLWRPSFSIISCECLRSAVSTSTLLKIEHHQEK